MRVTYDVETDSAYFHLVDDSEVTRTSSTDEGINLDFDGEGMLVGIEILEAKGKLPPYILDNADGA
jgi:uncharacterized protein YuzE